MTLLGGGKTGGSSRVWLFAVNLLQKSGRATCTGCVHGYMENPVYAYESKASDVKLN